MKILRLDLLAFGPFTDRVLDFGSDHGLRLVYGPNEAGKSSTLRALRDVLYGIPNNTGDDFVHSKPNLRLGAKLQHSSGDCLSFIRRKGNSKTLLNGDGATPLDDDVLLPYLGGFNRAAFEQMFGIDHAALVQGGNELVRLQGDAGKILFAAAGGITHLPEVQKKLKDDAEALFLPSGRKPRINATLSELDEAKKAVRKSQVPVKEWEEQDKRHASAVARVKELTEALQVKRHELSRLMRLVDSVPTAGKHRNVTARLAELGEVRLVPEDSPEHRAAILAELIGARSTAASAEERLKKLDEETQNLAAPQAILDRSEQFSDLSERLGSYRKAQRDLPGLQTQQEQSLAEARDILRELRPDLKLDDIDALRLSKKQQVDIQNLGNQQAGLAKEAETSRKELQLKETTRQNAVAELEELELPRDVSGLRNALEHARGRGPLEDDLATVRREMDQIKQQLDTELSRLPHWSGTLDALERLQVPSSESVDVFDEDLRSASECVRQLTRRIAEVEKAQADGTKQAERFRLEQGQVPTEEDLTAARQLRDRGWQLVQQQLQGETPDAANVDAFIRAVQPGAGLSVAFELSVRRADEVADRLRHEADRVAVRANLEAEQRARDSELQRLNGEKVAAEQQQAVVIERWHAVWQSLGIVPQTPKEMRAWILRQQALLRQCEELRKKQARFDSLQGQIDQSRADLSRCLSDLKELPAGETETLESIELRAASFLARLDEAKRKRDGLELQIRTLSAELQHDAVAAKKACEQLDAWKSRWGAAVEPLGLPADAMPNQASEVLQRWKELFDKLAFEATLAKRIKDIGEDAVRFRDEVQGLAREVGVETAATQVERLAERLIADWRKAGEDQARRELLVKEQNGRTKELAEAKKTIQRHTATLEAMCLEAGCATHEQLPEIEQRSAVVRQLRLELRQLEETLLQWSGGISLSDFLSALAAEDPDDLRTRIAAITAEIEALDLQLQQASAERGASELALAQLGHGTEAVEAAQKAQDLLARLATDSIEYARLRLASAVLRETIERFRKKNEGPIVQRAGQHFAQITGGRFAGLQVDYDADGHPLLVGLRTSGGTLRVEGMSEGTADQMYLALRLASLETYFLHQEPIPFIVDDILIKFDDERTIATLKALSNLARQTQVIVFTHHAHLVELAQKHLPAKELFVQQLGA
jgi:uncharacterized protein YhaN